MTAPVLLFPGQGTEAVGMAQGWEEDPAWKRILERAERHTGLPLRTWMAQGPGASLKAQRHAPVAVISHSVALFQAQRASALPLPAVAAGHSAGFFSALVAAEVVPLEAALDLIRHTEDLADARHPPGSMGMAYFIGITAAELRLVLSSREALALSNVNGKASFTVSGPLPDLEALLEEKGAACLRAGLLPVRQPLHGPHMTPLLPALAWRLRGVQPADPCFPLCSGVDGRLLTRGEEAWGEAIASVALPVDWVRVVGALAPFRGEWLECGFGSQLAGLTRWLDRQRLVRSLQSPPERAAGERGLARDSGLA